MNRDKQRIKDFDRKEEARKNKFDRVPSRVRENDSMDTDKKQRKRGSFWQSARDMEDENSPRLERGLERLVFCRSKGGEGRGWKKRKEKTI